MLQMYVCLLPLVLELRTWSICFCQSRVETQGLGLQTEGSECGHALLLHKLEILSTPLHYRTVTQNLVVSVGVSLEMPETQKWVICYCLLPLRVVEPLRVSVNVSSLAG